jgi:DNA polymerase IIIc chi subunit
VGPEGHEGHWTFSHPSSFGQRWPLRKPLNVILTADNPTNISTVRLLVNVHQTQKDFRLKFQQQLLDHVPARSRNILPSCRSKNDN